jgi:hypothetical protein
VTTSSLDLYEIAFLAGGPERVVDTAVVALVEAGRITVFSPGQLAVADPARRNPVEGAVLDAIGTRGHRSLDLVVWRLAGDDSIADIRRRLTADGLLRRRPPLRRAKDGPPVRTTAGNQLLRALETTPPVFSVHDGGSAVQVALHGPHGLANKWLRDSIFDVPRTTTRPGSSGLRQRLDARHRDSSYESTHLAFGIEAGGVLDGGGGGGGGGDGGGGI